jgi:Ca2+-binding RTX toxin-like protein
MTVTTSFSISSSALQFPGAVSNVAMTSLVGSGAAALADGASGIVGILYDALGNQTGTFTAVGTEGSITQLSNGNLVIVSELAGEIHYKIVNSVTGADVLATVDSNTPGANLGVTALDGAGFIVTSELAGKVYAYFYDENGGPLGNNTITISSDLFVNSGLRIVQMTNGNIALAWTAQNGPNTSIWTAILNTSGGTVQAPQVLDITDSVNRNVSITATATGFAVAYEGGPDGDIGIQIQSLAFDGTHIASTTRNAAGSDLNPQILALPDGMLALTFDYNFYSDTDPFFSLLNSTLAQTSTWGVYGGDDVVDDTENTAIAYMGFGRVAVLAENLTDGDVNGELLSTVFASIGDGDDDTALGNDFYPNFMQGNGGNDTLTGGLLSDTIEGNAGFDQLYGGDGNDSMSGGEDGDFISSDSGDDTVDGGAGFDVIYGGANNDTLSGGSEDDDLYGQGENDIISGDAGNDSLDGGTGVDSLNGGEGNDRLLHHGNDANEAGETFDGGDDFDTLVLTGTGTQLHDFSDDTINSIERVVWLYPGLPGFGQTHTLILNAGQFGSGIALDAVFEFDDSNNTQEIIQVALNGATSIDLSGLSFAGETSAAHFEIGAGDDVTYSSVTGSAIWDIIEGFGHETINGGGGQDTLSYAGLTSAPVVFYGNGAYGVGFGFVTYLISSIENVIGSGFDDEIYFFQDDGDNFIDGGDGADFVQASRGSDTVFGGDGDDSIETLDGNDSLAGDGGNDIIFALGGGSWLDGGADVDLLNYSRTASGPVTVSLAVSGPQDTGNGIDIILNFENLVGSYYNDQLTGSDGDNVLDGYYGNDTIAAGEGNDTIAMYSGGDSINGGGGVDIVDYSSSVGAVIVALYSQTGSLGDTLVSIEGIVGSVFNDLLVGDTTNDILNGGAGDDTLSGIGGENRLYGGSGNDLIFGGINSETLDGGVDVDVLSFTAAAVGVNVSLAITGPQNTGAGTDTILNFEDLVGSSLSDTLAGDAGDNLIDGHLGNDSLSGGAGNDTLRGSAGNDVFDGGANNDVVDYSTANVSVRVDLSNTAAQNTNWGMDRFVSVENIVGTLYNDTLTGSSGTNILVGYSGNDSLVGGGGADYLDGGTGNDRMVGGAANDFYFVDSTADIVTELAGEGTADTVITTRTTYVLPANVERVIYSGTEAFVGIGNIDSNRFSGNVGDDRFVDVAGGNDTISGGNGSDSMDFRSSTTGAIINLATGVHGGAAAGDVYSSIEKFFGSNTQGDTMTAGSGRANFSGFGGNDTLTGGNNIDALQGNAGNDALNGAGGIDNLDGGAGNDTMTGGTGNDYFVFSAAGFGQDVVTDFADGFDKLKVHSSIANNISAFNITGNGTTNVLLTQISSPTNTITLQSGSASAINVTAADFAFY